MLMMSIDGESLRVGCSDLCKIMIPFDANLSQDVIILSEPHVFTLFPPRIAPTE